MEEKRYCKVCGKELPRTITGKYHKSRVYCSDECRKKATAEYISNYTRERYKSDPEFRRHKSELSARCRKRKDAAKKEQRMQELVVDLMQASTSDEVRAILKERVSLRGFKNA